MQICGKFTGPASNDAMHWTSSQFDAKSPDILAHAWMAVCMFGLLLLVVGGGGDGGGGGGVFFVLFLFLWLLLFLLLLLLVL